MRQTADPGAELRYAAFFGDTNKVGELLSKHPEVVDSQSIPRETTISFSSFLRAFRDILGMRQISASDPEVRYQEFCNNATTALINAAYQSHYEVLDQLLERNADPDKRDRLQRTALFMATFRDPKDTPAKLEARLKVVNRLLASGADINIHGYAGNTPLFLASSSGFPECVELLLGKGAKITETSNNGFTPLHAAADSGNTNAIRLLVSHGANVNVSTTNGITPLAMAIKRRQTNAVALLKELGAN